MPLLPPRLPPPPRRLLRAPARPAVAGRSPLRRWERVVAVAIFSGLAVVLGIAAAVMVRPAIVDDFHPFWPALAGIGFCSTVGGFWWLWWRPR